MTRMRAEFKRYSAACPFGTCCRVADVQDVAGGSPRARFRASTWPMLPSARTLNVRTRDAALHLAFPGVTGRSGVATRLVTVTTGKAYVPSTYVRCARCCGGKEVPEVSGVRPDLRPARGP